MQRAARRITFLSPSAAAGRAALMQTSYHRSEKFRMTRSIMTRILHSLLAFAVMYQLAISLVMEGPRRGHEAAGLPGALFETHEWVGLSTLAVLVLFWIWALVRRGETGLGVLLPWFSRDRMRGLREDLARHGRALRQRRLPAYRAQSPLAAAIHGLGLLLFSAMALTGTVYFIWHGHAGEAGTAAKAAKEVHTTLANLAWAYLIGHAGMAMLHHLSGHDIIQPMFKVRHSVEGSGNRPQEDPSRSAL